MVGTSCQEHPTLLSLPLPSLGPGKGESPVPHSTPFQDPGGLPSRVRRLVLCPRPSLGAAQGTVPTIRASTMSWAPDFLVGGSEKEWVCWPLNSSPSTLGSRYRPLLKAKVPPGLGQALLSRQGRVWGWGLGSVEAELGHGGAGTIQSPAVCWPRRHRHRSCPGNLQLFLEQETEVSGRPGGWGEGPLTLGPAQRASAANVVPIWAQTELPPHVAPQGTSAAHTGLGSLPVSITDTQSPNRTSVLRMTLGRGPTPLTLTWSEPGLPPAALCEASASLGGPWRQQQSWGDPDGARYTYLTLDGLPMRLWSHMAPLKLCGWPGSPWTGLPETTCSVGRNQGQPWPAEHCWEQRGPREWLRGRALAGCVRGPAPPCGAWGRVVQTGRPLSPGLGHWNKSMGQICRGDQHGVWGLADVPTAGRGQ